MWLFETWNSTEWAKYAHAEAKIIAKSAVTKTTSTTDTIKAALSVNKQAHINATTTPTSKQEQP